MQAQCGCIFRVSAINSIPFMPGRFLSASRQPKPSARILSTAASALPTELTLRPFIGRTLESTSTTMGSAAGAMVFSLGLGLMAHNNVNTFSYGYDKVRFIKPVFIGDTIYTIRTHLEKWPKYPTLGMVRVSYEVFKIPGELVLYCEHLQTVKYRGATQFKVQTAKE